MVPASLASEKIFWIEFSLAFKSLACQTRCQLFEKIVIGGCLGLGKCCGHIDQLTVDDGERFEFIRAGRCRYDVFESILGKSYFCKSQL